MLHKDQTGDDAVHPSSFIQSADPGAVGAGKEWTDITDGTGPLAVRKIRNAANSGWDVAHGHNVADIRDFHKRFAAAVAIDLLDGRVQSLTLANGANVVTLANPAAGGRYLLELKQPASGAAGTVTWPAAVKWSGGVAPTLTATNGRTDIVELYYNGTNYAGWVQLDFAL